MNHRVPSKHSSCHRDLRGVVPRVLLAHRLSTAAEGTTPTISRHTLSKDGGDASALTGTEAAEKVGETALLSASTIAAVALIVDSDPTYKVWDDSKAAHPNLLATIPKVTQRLSNEDTGTLFFLSKNRVTVVRRLRVEEDHKIDVIWKSQTWCSRKG